jgi:hypothetical protein
MKNFTENFNKNDIEEFIKNPVIEFKPHGEGGYIMCSINSFGPRPEFVYNNFTFKGINTYASYDYSTHWRKFVLSKLNDELLLGILMLSVREIVIRLSGCVHCLFL